MGNLTKYLALAVIFIAACGQVSIIPFAIPTDINKLSVVQLCPSLGEPVYPTNFPEVALCISSNLYAVYDQDGNHVFLSMIPPGVYRSTSPQTCNFTVRANCVVEQN